MTAKKENYTLMEKKKNMKKEGRREIEHDRVKYR